MGHRILYIPKLVESDIVLVINNTGAIAVSSWSSSGGYAIANGQEFILTGYVKKVTLKFDTPQGSPNFNIRAKIYEGSVANDNYALSSSTLLGSSTNTVAASSANGYVTFDFNNIYCNGNLKSVVFIFEDIVTHNSINYIKTLIEGSNPYADGTRLSCAATANWFSSSIYDLHMNITYSLT